LNHFIIRDDRCGKAERDRILAAERAAEGYTSDGSGSTVEHVVKAITRGRKDRSMSHKYLVQPLTKVERDLYLNPLAKGMLTKRQKKLAKSALAMI
jgi:hypothetical protein